MNRNLAGYPRDIGNLLALGTVHAVRRLISFRFLSRRRSFRHFVAVEATQNSTATVPVSGMQGSSKLEL